MSTLSRSHAASVEPATGAWETLVVNRGDRSRRLFAVLSVLAALALVVPRILAYTPYARLGVELEWTPDGHARVSSVVGPPAEGLLERGDLLLTIDGITIKPPSLSASTGKPTLPRDAITLGVSRGGAHLDVVVPPARISVWNRIRFLFLPLAAVIAAPLVAFALVWRRPDLGTAGVFLWFAALQAVSVVHEIYHFPEVEPTGAFKLLMGAMGWLVCWWPASLLHFMMVFPRPRWSSDARWKSPWFWLVAVGYLVPLAFVLRLIRTGSVGAVPFRAFETTALLLGVASLVDRVLRPARAGWAPTAGQRTLALVAAGMYLAATGLDWMLTTESIQPLLQLPVMRLLMWAVSGGLPAVPFIMAYLIALDPAFDPRRLLERGLPYALLSGVLAALYLVLVLVGQRLFAAATGEQATAFNIVAALVLAFAFAPLRERLQRWLDRLFRRDPLALRLSLDQVGRELLGALDRDEVRDSVASGIERGLGRPVEITWPEAGPPHVAESEELPEHARGAIEALLIQAGIRIENLALQDQRAAAERRAVELREAATRAELRALHAQVQPHFLFNALNALSYLIETDPPAAQRFTERLADMLRYTVEASERAASLLSEEIGFVEAYLGVARERYEGDLTFDYRGPRELLSAAVPPLLLQPLVENSVKHGYAPDRARLHMVLEARRESGWLTLRFSDDGAPRANGDGPDRAPAGLGFGLENLDQRVRRFGGRDTSLMASACPGGGFAVTLRWREGDEGGIE